MDINQSIKKMLSIDYKLEHIELSHTKWFNCTFSNNNGESFKLEIKDIQGLNRNIYYVKLTSVTDFKQFTEAFNINLSAIHKNIRILKNEFNFFNNFVCGKNLEFESLEEFYQCGILRTSRKTEDFFAYSVEISLDLPHLSTTILNRYSYFDKISGGIFEDSLTDFKLLFLKKYVSSILEKPINELLINDYKVLHMLNI